MAATKLQSGWTDVAHGAVTITRVDTVSFDQGGQVSTYAGDNDRIASAACVLMSSPTASVTSSDTATLMGIPVGTEATLTATHKDAKLATGGDILYTLTNAVAQGASTSGSHAQFGNATLQFTAYATDGQTNPLSFTRA